MSGSSIAALKQGIVNNIVTAYGDLLTQVEVAPLTSPTPPCMWVERQNTEQFTNDRGTLKHIFLVKIIVGLSDDLASQALVDRLIQPSNGPSIIEAIDSDSTLGGFADDLWVADVAQDTLARDQAAQATSQYLTVDVTVEVYAPGA